ncbi:MAG TPA: HAMP domain-containing sensor histidine kinase [Candidatus Dormibacteraeota bacterium]
MAASLSLRARLLLSVIGLVTVALVVAGVATYTALQQFLTAQLDDSLRSSVHPAFQFWRDYNSGRFGQPAGVPGGSYMALYSPSGDAIGTALAIELPNGRSGAPVITHKFPAASEAQPALLSAGGTGAVSDYRVAIAPLDEAGGNVFVLAEPLTGINATLTRLLLLEGLVGGFVLLSGGALAWLLVRASLRPLARIESTAAAIAAGDLAQRVEIAEPGTEVGRLGLALNAMLTQIEGAFAERTRSEQQLRQFMAAASHELRTPLTSIRGYAEMLRRGAEGSARDAGVARRRIEEETVRMTGLVDDMLLLARLDQGRPLESQRVDLARLAADACEDARAVAPSRLITLEAPPELWLRGDEARLRQATGNLVRNALVHTPPGEPIEVSVRGEDGQAILDVIDHGRGLGSDEKRRIFEPFYRGGIGRSRDQGGAGLGLSIVAAVVAAHRGTVQVLDTDGHGATFRVMLPLHHGTADDALAPARIELSDELDGAARGELSTAP